MPDLKQVSLSQTNYNTSSATKEWIPAKASQANKAPLGQNYTDYYLGLAEGTTADLGLQLQRPFEKEDRYLRFFGQRLEAAPTLRSSDLLRRDIRQTQGFHQAVESHREGYRLTVSYARRLRSDLHRLTNQLRSLPADHPDRNSIASTVNYLQTQKSRLLVVLQERYGAVRETYQSVRRMPVAQQYRQIGLMLRAGRMLRQFGLARQSLGQNIFITDFRRDLRALAQSTQLTASQRSDVVYLLSLQNRTRPVSRLSFIAGNAMMARHVTVGDQKVRLGDYCYEAYRRVRRGLGARAALTAFSELRIDGSLTHPTEVMRRVSQIESRATTSAQAQRRVIQAGRASQRTHRARVSGGILRR